MQYNNIKLENFLNELKKLDPDLELELISKVLKFSETAHAEQVRSSGETYITHPVNVAYVLAQLKMSSAVISAGLLHDILEDTAISKTELKTEFGNEITLLVDGLTKIHSYTYKSLSQHPKVQADNFRKLLISITKDVRIIIIKLADRLHNMRTLQFLPDEKKERIAQETLDIYAPLANRFGMAVIQWELEDLCLKYLYPEDHRTIVELVALKQHEREKQISELVKETDLMLQENGIKAKIQGRNKHLYSIWRKHRIKQRKLADILDLRGIRIIVEDVEDCYKVLGLMQSRYIPLESGFKDYISQPKDNGYQSLHLNAVTEDDRQLEIQIRTSEMHLIAEEGIAAHWHYKEAYGTLKKDRAGKPYIPPQDPVNKNVAWIRNFLQEQQKNDPVSFMESLKNQLFPDIIVVRTPENKYIKLKKHSTPIDFAFKLHTNIGLHMIGAYINGEYKPVRTELKNGDVVKIMTSPQAKPSKDWLIFLTSSKAKQKVRQYFRNIELQKWVTEGKDLFAKRIRKLPIKVKTEAEILALARQFRVNDIKSFFAELGAGNLSFEEIKQVLLPEEPEIEESEEIEPVEEKGKVIGSNIILENIDNLMIRFAKCCNPQPGDKIVGYTTRGKGITVHKKSCSNKGFTDLWKKEPERIMQVKWNREAIDAETE